MLLLVTLCGGLGVFTALRVPETFTTAARMLVEEPQIPDSMVESTVQIDAIEQLDIIQQRLLTRSNLIDIANKFDVYDDLGEVDPDEIVERMERDTIVARTAGRNQATLLTIEFEGRSGQIVSDVVNEYVSRVLEFNTDFRTTRAESTLSFFEDEVEQLSAELSERSSEIAAFKRVNSNALPEDQAYRLGRQSLLQERISLLEKDLRAARAQKTDLSRLFETTGRIGRGNEAQQMTAEEQQLITAKAELELAKSVYSDENPRIIRLQSTVDRLEAIVAAQTASGLAGGDAEDAVSPEEALFQATISEIDNRIEALEVDIDRTNEELLELQTAISASSSNGISLENLEREMEVVQTRYDAALANLNGAQMSERIETTGEGQRISIIESAFVPREPSGPNRPKIAALGGLIGIMLAAGYFGLLEFLNRTIRRPAELIGRFNVTPIATVPYIESGTQKLMRRSTLIILTLIVLVGVPLILWYIDTNYLPLDLLVRRALEQVGIN
jgi:uncharacterized protein involved in exopolysaccharide biosynthesis